MLKIKNNKECLLFIMFRHQIQGSQSFPRCITYKIPPAFPLNTHFIAITTIFSAFLSFIVKMQISAFSSQLLHLLYSPLTYVIHLVSSTLLFRESWYYFYTTHSCNFGSALVSQECGKLNLSSR